MSRADNMGRWQLGTSVLSRRRAMRRWRLADGWQPPRDEFACGFLRDGRTLVTVPRSASGNRRMGTPETGPVRLWDIDTGRLRASHFSPEDVFDRVLVNQALDMLCVQQRAPD